MATEEKALATSTPVLKPTWSDEDYQSVWEEQGWYITVTSAIEYNPNNPSQPTPYNPDNAIHVNNAKEDGFINILLYTDLIDEIPSSDLDDFMDSSKTQVIKYYVDERPNTITKIAVAALKESFDDIKKTSNLSLSAEDLEKPHFILVYRSSSWDGDKEIQKTVNNLKRMHELVQKDPSMEPSGTDFQYDAGCVNAFLIELATLMAKNGIKASSSEDKIYIILSSIVAGGQETDALQVEKIYYVASSGKASLELKSEANGWQSFKSSDSVSSRCLNYLFKKPEIATYAGTDWRTFCKFFVKPIPSPVPKGQALADKTPSTEEPRRLTAAEIRAEEEKMKVLVDKVAEIEDKQPVKTSEVQASEAELMKPHLDVFKRGLYARSMKHDDAFVGSPKIAELLAGGNISSPSTTSDAGKNNDEAIKQSQRKGIVPNSEGQGDFEGKDGSSEEEEETSKEEVSSLVYPTAEPLEMLYTDWLNRIQASDLARTAYICILRSLPKIEITGIDLTAIDWERIRDVFSIHPVDEFVNWFGSLIPTTDELKAFANAVIKAITDAIVNALVEALKAILQAIANACINYKEDYGELDIGAILDEIAKENAQQAEDIKTGIASSLGDNVDSATLTSIGSFLDDASTMMTPSELCEILQGAASKQLMEYLRILLESKYPELAGRMPTNEELRKMFVAMGMLLPFEICEKIQKSIPPPEDKLWCGDNSAEERRKKWLALKNLTPEQIDEQLAQEKEKKIAQLQDLASFINDPNGHMQEKINQSLCGTNPVFIEDPPSLTYMIGKTVDTLLETPRNNFDSEIIEMRDKIMTHPKKKIYIPIMIKDSEENEMENPTIQRLRAMGVPVPIDPESSEGKSKGEANKKLWESLPWINGTRCWPQDDFSTIKIAPELQEKLLEFETSEDLKITDYANSIGHQKKRFIEFTTIDPSGVLAGRMPDLLSQLPPNVPASVQKQLKDIQASYKTMKDQLISSFAAEYKIRYIINVPDYSENVSAVMLQYNEEYEVEIWTKKSVQSQDFDVLVTSFKSKDVLNESIKDFMTLGMNWLQHQACGGLTSELYNYSTQESKFAEYCTNILEGVAGGEKFNKQKKNLHQYFANKGYSHVLRDMLSQMIVQVGFSKLFEVVQIPSEVKMAVPEQTQQSSATALPMLNTLKFTQGPSDVCPETPHLLSLESLKESVKEQKKKLCLMDRLKGEDTIPKDLLSKIVAMTTLRVYLIEMYMKGIFVYTTYHYDDGSQFDELLINFFAESIIKDIVERFGQESYDLMTKYLVRQYKTMVGNKDIPPDPELESYMDTSEEDAVADSANMDEESMATMKPRDKEEIWKLIMASRDMQKLIWKAMIKVTWQGVIKGFADIMGNVLKSFNKPISSYIAEQWLPTLDIADPTLGPAPSRFLTTTVGANKEMLDEEGIGPDIIMKVKAEEIKEHLEEYIEFTTPASKDWIKKNVQLTESEIINYENSIKTTAKVQLAMITEWLEKKKPELEKIQSKYPDTYKYWETLALMKTEPIGFKKLFQADKAFDSFQRKFDLTNGQIILEKYATIKVREDETAKQLIKQIGVTLSSGLYSLPTIQTLLAKAYEGYAALNIKTNLKLADILEKCTTGIRMTYIPPLGEDAKAGVGVNQTFKDLDYGESPNIYKAFKIVEKIDVLKLSKNPISISLYNTNGPIMEPNLATLTELDDEEYTVYSIPLLVDEQATDIQKIEFASIDALDKFIQDLSVNCLSQRSNLKKQDAYKFLFEYAVPLQHFASVIALYTTLTLQDLYAMRSSFFATKTSLYVLLDMLEHQKEYDYSKKYCASTPDFGKLPCMGEALQYILSQAMPVTQISGCIQPGVGFGKLLAKLIMDAPKFLLKGLAKITDPNIAIALFISELACLQKLDLPVQVISMLQFPMNVFLPPPLGPGFGSPITPMGFAYLALEGLSYLGEEATEMVENAMNNDKKDEKGCKNGQ